MQAQAAADPANGRAMALRDQARRLPVQAQLEAGRPRLFTRRGYDWTNRFAALARAMTELPANNLILDGEVIVQGETGAADFDALQADLASGRSERMVYFAFDLLYLDGFDLRKAPLIERKRVLAALLEEAKSDCFHLAQHLGQAGAFVFEQACAMGLEGIVCKLRDAPCRSGPRELAQDQTLRHGVPGRLAPARPLVTGYPRLGELVSKAPAECPAEHAQERTMGFKPIAPAYDAAALSVLEQACSWAC